MVRLSAVLVTILVLKAVVALPIIVKEHYESHQPIRRTAMDVEEEQSDGSGRNFHEVDAFGHDMVSFGAQTGLNGAFSWHASYPLEKASRH